MAPPVSIIVIPSPTHIQRLNRISNNPPTASATSSAVGAQSGRCMFVPANIVPSSAACVVPAYCAPIAVGTGLAIPAAVTSTITTAPSKSSGKSATLTFLLR